MDKWKGENEGEVKEKTSGMQVGQEGREGGIREGERKVGGWLATQATPGPQSTNIGVGGIYSYKLSAGPSWGGGGGKGARRGGFVSIKGIEVLSYSTLPRSFLLSFSLPNNALLVFRACSSSRTTVPFSTLRSFHPLLSGHQIGRRISRQQQASREPTSS